MASLVLEEVDEEKTTPWYLWYKFKAEQKVGRVDCSMHDRDISASTLWRKGES